MPTKIEKDDVTGVETTGHEWDGIKELNTPLPSWWVYTFFACIAFAVLWMLLYPAIPLGNFATSGLLGTTARERVTAEIETAQAARAAIEDRILAASLDDIRTDQTLQTYALTGGRIAFGNNCAQCHAVGGAGQLNYPVLADDDWLWGGSLEDIQRTILYGVRNAEYELDARFSLMPAFGADGLLDRAQIDQVTAYVLLLGGAEVDPADVGEGETLYVENCASCHGDDGKGIVELGAPNLTDAIWLYGGEPEEIAQQIWAPHHGVMPGFVDRLDAGTIKMLATYVHSLGGGQ
ncbi:MAG: cytochrome-c oxidase, cbb3-type subunit III [Pseudomonadota bacterium]